MSEDSVLPEEVVAFLDDWLGSNWTADPLEGDISTRSYTRVRSGERVWVVAHYPKEIRQDLDRYRRAAEALSECARIPELVAADSSCVAQTDVGDLALRDVLHDDREKGRSLYLQAIDELVRFQTARESMKKLNPPFGETRFMWELEMTGDFYAERLMGDRSQESEAARTEIFRKLARKLTTHPYVLCHRDYHGENIHVLGEELYIIDFQDARLGPDTYDLASLLRDRAVIEDLGRDFEKRAILHYASLLEDTTVEERYWETLLQRTLKTIGSFVMVAVRKGRHHYLDWIGPALETVNECLERLPEYRPLTEVFPMHYDGRKPDTTEGS